MGVERVWVVFCDECEETSTPDLFEDEAESMARRLDRFHQDGDRWLCWACQPPEARAANEAAAREKVEKLRAKLKAEAEDYGP